jgi:Flp pilus assembly protein TadD
MTPLPPARRVFCALLALTAAALLFRGPLAAAVVTRGDEALRAGYAPAALRAYRKALALDPASAVAADRLAFQLALAHRPAAAGEAIAVATAALRGHPADEGLLVDRGFAELQLHDDAAARADFALAGTIAHDARYTALAQRLERKAR